MMSRALTAPAAVGSPSRAVFSCCHCGGAARWPQSLSPGRALHALCDGCAAKAVLNSQDVGQIYELVCCFLAQHLAMNMRTFLAVHNVHLVAPGQWTNAEGHTHTLGQAHTVVQPMPGGQLPRLLKAEVRLLRGMPWVQAAGVLAHEAFHVYSAAQGLHLDRATEEGSANLWMYLFLATHPGSRHAEDLRCQMLQDPDEIYGEGFRAAREAYKNAKGFGAYVRGLTRACTCTGTPHTQLSVFNNRL